MQVEGPAKFKTRLANRPSNLLESNDSWLVAPGLFRPAIYVWLGPRDKRYIGQANRVSKTWEEAIGLDLTTPGTRNYEHVDNAKKGKSASNPDGLHYNINAHGVSAFKVTFFGCLR